MKTVHEVSKQTGVSVRTLHHYDAIGLLKPSAVTEAGYRLYDEDSLVRLGQILLFKELDFPLREIRTILERPEFDREAALQQQIGLLQLKKERLENLIAFAEKIKETGVYQMEFEVFDRQKQERYAAEAKKLWGGTDAYREYCEKTAETSEEQQSALASEMMAIFASFGAMRDRSPEDAQVQALVKGLQAFITEHYYTCTKKILAGLGQMYAAGGEMTDNIDAAGGEGTAVFASRAIEAYCR